MFSYSFHIFLFIPYFFRLFSYFLHIFFVYFLIFSIFSSLTFLFFIYLFFAAIIPSVSILNNSLPKCADPEVLARMVAIDAALTFHSLNKLKNSKKNKNDGSIKSNNNNSSFKNLINNGRVSTNISVVTKALKAMQLEERRKEKERGSGKGSADLPPGKFLF